MREKDLRNLVKGLTEKTEKLEKQIWEARSILKFILEMEFIDNNICSCDTLDDIEDFLEATKDISVRNKKEVASLDTCKCQGQCCDERGHCCDEEIEDETDTNNPNEGKTWGC